MNAALRTPKDVGAAIRARRRSLGWDQAELARRIGVSRLWVNQIEGGKPGAGLGLILQAFNALELTLRVTTPDDLPAPAGAVALDSVLEAARKPPP